MFPYKPQDKQHLLEVKVDETITTNIGRSLEM